LKQIDLRDPETIRKAMRNSDVVINCIGLNAETANFKFKDTNVEGARTIARIARECKIQKLIHFSALNASPNPTKILTKPSQFLISKV
jgi:NADH dehydrogenase (ubiquinone) 1 alpha subcomplex subunit 9